MPKKYVYKILVAGQGGVGKTTLLTRIVTGKFMQNTAMTIGVEFHLLNLTLGKGDNAINTVIQLWDFGGQERFRFMLDSYVAGARGALLLYDLTRLRTLDGLDEWVKIVRTHDKDLPILFVGTKLDRTDDITVSDEYAREFLEPLNMFDHLKISSKDGTGVEKAFKMITRKVLEINGVYVPPESDEDQVESPQQSTVPTASTPEAQQPSYTQQPTVPTSPSLEPPSYHQEPAVSAQTTSEEQKVQELPQEEKTEEEKKKPKRDSEEDLYSYFTKSSN
ncbi:MAG: GTP-binding protein [Promethearchaeota archaeon]